jgi:hypothetical protein
MLRPVALLVLVLLAGCAAPEVRWQKAGTGAATLQDDLDQCTQEARLQARREQVPSAGLGSLPGGPPVIGTDTQGRPVQAPRPPRQGDRFLAEHDLTRSCMRGKGYEQVPLEGAGKS